MGLVLLVLLHLAATASSVAPRVPWAIKDRVAAHEKLTFTAALFQRDVPGLLAAVEERAAAPSTTAWLTREQVMGFVVPRPEDKRASLRALRAAGLTLVADHGDYVRVRSSVANVEALFNTSCHWFEHQHSGRPLARCMDYTMPASLRAHVEVLADLVDLPMHPGRRSRAATPLSASRTAPDFEMLTAPFVRWMYNVSNATLATNASLTVVEFLDANGFLQSDLAFFASTMSVPQLGPVQLAGAPMNFSGGAAGVESSMDVQYGLTAGRGAAFTYWNEAGWLLSWAQAFFTAPTSTVVSLSYGVPESFQCLTGIGACTNATAYVLRVNTELAKIAGMGITIVAASGDNGAPGDENTDCTPGFSTMFPCDSPYVLCVGGTMLGTRVGDATVVPFVPPPVCNWTRVTCAIGDYTQEQIVVWPTALITSGGGFARLFPTPSFQASAVAAYFKHEWDLPPPGYNRHGRGFPDVAALAHGFLVAMNGEYFVIDGTSAATPIWAGIIANLNSERKAVGKRELGFVNTLLYNAPPGVLVKIPKGTNGCTTGCCDQYGFQASKQQWDPAGGLGSINYLTLRQYVLSAP